MKGIWKASVAKWHKDSRRKRTSKRQFFKDNQNFYKKGKLIGVYDVEEIEVKKFSGKVKVLIKEKETIPIGKLIHFTYAYSYKNFFVKIDYKDYLSLKFLEEYNFKIYLNSQPKKEIKKVKLRKFKKYEVVENIEKCKVRIPSLKKNSKKYKKEMLRFKGVISE